MFLFSGALSQPAIAAKTLIGFIDTVTALQQVKSAASVVFWAATLTLGFGIRAAQGAPAETAPASLTSALTTIEAAANSQDIAGVMAIYGDSFQGADGFTRDQYQSALEQFWGLHSSLSYDVELLSWEGQGNALVAETLTTVTGQRENDGREFTLTSMVRSRQQFVAGQIVSQEILSEESQLQSGSPPPDVIIQLPETVAPGERFSFDAIVKEPLGDRLLLGRAFDEGTTAEDFFVTRPLALEQLSAGGLFKVGQAPNEADQRWISGILIREDGIVITTRRLQVSQQPDAP